MLFDLLFNPAGITRRRPYLCGRFITFIGIALSGVGMVKTGTLRPPMNLPFIMFALWVYSGWALDTKRLRAMAKNIFLSSAFVAAYLIAALIHNVLLSIIVVVFGAFYFYWLQNAPTKESL